MGFDLEESLIAVNTAPTEANVWFSFLSLGIGVLAESVFYL